MAAPASRSFLSTVLVFGIIIGLCVWIGLVLTSQGEDRLEQACKPVEYTTNLLHEVTTAVLGRQPTWTLYVQRYLMTGCYYTFSVILSQRLPGEDADTFGGENDTREPVTGGIQ